MKKRFKTLGTAEVKKYRNAQRFFPLGLFILAEQTFKKNLATWDGELVNINKIQAVNNAHVLMYRGTSQP